MNPRQEPDPILGEQISGALTRASEEGEGGLVAPLLGQMKMCSAWVLIISNNTLRPEMSRLQLYLHLVAHEKMTQGFINNEDEQYLSSIRILSLCMHLVDAWNVIYFFATACVIWRHNIFCPVFYFGLNQSYFYCYNLQHRENLMKEIPNIMVWTVIIQWLQLNCSH